MNNGTVFSPLVISYEKNKCLNLPLTTSTSRERKKQKPKWFLEMIEAVSVLSFFWRGGRGVCVVEHSCPLWIRTSNFFIFLNIHLSKETIWTLLLCSTKLIIIWT